MRLSKYFACAAVTVSLGAGSALAYPTITVGGTPSTGNGLISSRSGITTDFTFDDGGCHSSETSDGSGDRIIDSGTISKTRLAPADDTSCYLSIGINSQTSIGEVQLSLQTSGIHTPTYVGFYWGSIDEYNSVQLLDNNGVPISLGASIGTTLTGTEVLNAFGLGNDANGVAPSAYINFDNIDPNAHVTSIRFFSSNNAFEFDNLEEVVPTLPPLSPQPSIAQANVLAVYASQFVVPEPASPLLLGLGGLGLWARTRRRSAR